MTSLSNTAKRKIANSLKSIRDDEVASKSRGYKGNIEEGATQDYMPFRDIKNGIIITKDDRYVGMVEVYPINPDTRSKVELEQMVMGLSALYANGPQKILLKMMSDRSNPMPLINSVQKAAAFEKKPQMLPAVEDYINFIYKLYNNGAVSWRYFIFYEYQGDEEGKRSKKIEEILQTMQETETYIKSTMASCGNLCANPDNPTRATAEFLYTFFNRKSSREISFEERYQRLKSDFGIFNELTGREKKMLYADIVASKGIWLGNRNYVAMDGTCYGYLGIQTNHFPKNVCFQWLNALVSGDSIDIDIISKRFPQQLASFLLSQYNKATEKTIQAFLNRGWREMAEDKMGQLQNNVHVHKSLGSGDTILDMAIVLTVKANSPRELAAKMRAIKKQGKHYGIRYEDSFLQCEEYSLMTMPFLFFKSPYQRLKHNILGSQTGYMYPFTFYAINDPRGYVLGLNEDTSTIVAVNNFDTSLYNNGNMVILGEPGAGKTFAELLIGRRFTMNGGRAFYIIPKKGLEDYRDACKDMGGTFAQIIPGSKDCINIMEIRPEGKFNAQLLAAEDRDNRDLQTTGSWLGKKIMSLCVWIDYLLDSPMTKKESIVTEQVLKEVYAEHGIGYENETLFDEFGSINSMPIIEEWYKKSKEHEETERITDALTEFVYGACSNFNSQTNIDLNNNYIVFDIDEDIIGSKRHPAFLYIAFDFVYGEVRRSELTKDLVFLDEVWKLMKDERTAEQVRNMCKILRGYGGATVLATQEILDFINAPGGFGKSAVATSAIRLILKMNSTDLDLIKKDIGINEKEYQDITKFRQGYGIFISGGEKVSVHIIPSARDLDVFGNSDVNRRIAKSQKAAAG